MRNILLTGGTGVVGSALIPRLLADGDAHVWMLTRAATADDLQAKLRRLQEFWREAANDEVEGNALDLSRLHPISGDVRSPLLGLDSAAYDRLCDCVTHVVHSAGDVRLNQSLEEARACAVGGLERILTFAADCRRHGQFVKLDAVSTVGVAGRQRGLIPEAPLTGERQYRNTYEAAKHAAEEVLLRAMAEGLPATIHRPSMVVGDSRSGRVSRFQVFYYLSELLAGRRTWGVVPDTGPARLDIVPVDYVVDAIALASKAPDSVGRVFHLCSGPEQAVPLRQLADRLRTLFADEGIRLPRRRIVSPAAVRRVLPWAVRLSPPRVRRALATAPYFLAYLEDEQTFDNAATQAYFTERGLILPQVDEYLDRIVGYYLRKRRAAKESAVGAAS